MERFEAKCLLPYPNRLALDAHVNGRQHFDDFFESDAQLEVLPHDGYKIFVSFIIWIYPFMCAGTCFVIYLRCERRVRPIMSAETCVVS